MKGSVIFILALFMSAVITLQAQAQEEWLWDQSGFGFTIAEGMNATQNDGKTFTPDRENLIVFNDDSEMRPWKWR